MILAHNLHFDRGLTRCWRLKEHVSWPGTLSAALTASWCPSFSISELRVRQLVTDLLTTYKYHHSGAFFCKFEIPVTLVHLWTYIREMYQLDAFLQSNPADQVKILLSLSLVTRIIRTLSTCTRTSLVWKLSNVKNWQHRIIPLRFPLLCLLNTHQSFPNCLLAFSFNFDCLGVNLQLSWVIFLESFNPFQEDNLFILCIN